MATEKRIVEPKPVYTTRLVKSEDLNHHGTLFAGRTAEWFVESGFIAAASILNPRSVVCLKVHGMYFSKPARPGDILKFVSKIAYAGSSSLTSYVEVMMHGIDYPLVSGYVTFIHVDENTKPLTHNLQINPVTEDDKKHFEEASMLKR